MNYESQKWQRYQPDMKGIEVLPGACKGSTYITAWVNGHRFARQYMNTESKLCITEYFNNEMDLFRDITRIVNKG